MIDAFLKYKKDFSEWCDNGYLLSISGESKAEKASRFLNYLLSQRFQESSDYDLYKHQKEALLRTIYSFEILNKKDLLLNVVTGGGKTVIIAGVIAYLRIVHDFNKFLILVPNTIVRQRLVDDFDPKSGGFIYNIFQFFFDDFEYMRQRFSLHIMEQGSNSAGIRTSNIILGNVHQIHDGKINLDVIMDDRNIHQIAIFNDEAHNTKAKQYNLLLRRLEEKRLIRVDTTATPERLDGLHPDSEMIYEYNIKQAMRDKIVKRIVVFKPDVDKVKLKWKDDEGKIYSIDEVPWDQVEKGWVERTYDGKKVKIPSVKYVMDDQPSQQLLQVAMECLKHQKKAVPIDSDGKPKYKPLLLIVTFCIEDAKHIAKILRGELFNKKVLIVTNKSPEEDKKEAMELNKDMKNVEYDVIVSVMMLREGWDVKNISVICLFRKFSYKKIGDRIMSVFGPQVIGRGLRRISHKKDQWESLFVVDHPILKHDWLWDQLDADKYDVPLNPGDVIDEQKIPEHDEEVKGTDNVDKTGEGAEDTDWEKIAGTIPEYDDERNEIKNWQKFLDEYEYTLEGMAIEEVISQIKARNLDSGFNTLDSDEIPNVDVGSLKEPKDWSVDDIQRLMFKQIDDTAYDALIEYDGNPDARHQTVYKIICLHLKKRFLAGNDMSKCRKKDLLYIVWNAWPQIRANFLKPELIEAIFTDKKN